MLLASRPGIPENIANGKILVDKKLGAGCFGEVWHGVNSETKEEVAVKFEELSGNVAPQLEREAHMLTLIRSPAPPQGFAECFLFGTEGSRHFMVMEHLGRSLEDRLQMCGGRFTVKTTVLAAEQLLRRLEYLHSKGIVHRDIKPENFMWGTKEKMHHLYLIDFGLSKRYYERRHVKLTQKRSMTGTARYASLNAHQGFEQSRRDDLEAIGYMLFYFLRGKLPWSGLWAKSKEEKYAKILQKKQTVMPSELCEGFPQSFEAYLSYCRNLGFMERPDYDMLQSLFSDIKAKLAKESGLPIEDHAFEWLEGGDLGSLCPLQAPARVLQPDDREVRSRPRVLACFCGAKDRVSRVQE